MIIGQKSSLVDKKSKYAPALLKTLGVTISVDDFGTGYSSLSYLPLDTLKIDQSFIGDIRPYGDHKGIVTAIITMAKSLKLNIVAEGVVSHHQLLYLLEQKVNFAQGYYFSNALPAQDFEHFMSAHQAKVESSDDYCSLQ